MDLTLFGAINIKTQKYEFPENASKKDSFKCPDCDEKVFLKKGNIKRHHFCHYSSSTCSFYNGGGESECHKNGKLIMKYLLDNKCEININSICEDCNRMIKTMTINNNDYKKTKAEIEHKFKYNGFAKYADVALIKGDKIKYIFEIFNWYI